MSKISPAHGHLHSAELAEISHLYRHGSIFSIIDRANGFNEAKIEQLTLGLDLLVRVRGVVI